MRMRALNVLPSLVLALIANTASAEQSATFGDYTVHYNALPTEMLEPSIAKLYKIRRSKNRALLNVSVLKKKMGLTGQPIKAEVSATATNLNGQLRKVDMRELSDKGAIYYIGELTVSNQETLKFTLEVTPEGQSESFVARFEQQFFTE